MNKPIIAVDIDDVLAIENEAVRVFANENYGFTHTAEDYLAPGEYWGYWESVQGLGSEEGRRHYDEYLASGAKSDLQVMDGALEALSSLRERFDLVIVTSREAHLAEITEAWLNRHFPEIFNDIAFVALWTGAVKGSKADVCLQLRAQYLIDDNPGHLELARECGIKGILFGEYGWSKGKTIHPDIVRLGSWADIREYFDAIA